MRSGNIESLRGDLHEAVLVHVFKTPEVADRSGGCESTLDDMGVLHSEPSGKHATI